MKNIFDRKEFEYLKKFYGCDAEEKDIDLNLKNKTYFYELKENVETDRRGEVVFAVERPNGKMIVVRTSFYPEGIYRIPTGGINYGEDIVHALNREIKEELGLEAHIEKFLGALKFNLQHENENINFYSYIFWVKEKSGELLVDALEDEISEYREVDKSEMEQVVNILNGFTGSWRDWCTFRAHTTAFIMNYM